MLLGLPPRQRGRTGTIRLSLLSRICGAILVPGVVPSCDKGQFPHPKDALIFFDGALKLARETPDAGFPFTAYLGRARALIALGRTAEGESILRKALIDAQRDHMRVREARILVALGHLARTAAMKPKLGRASKARHGWRKSCICVVSLPQPHPRR